MFKKWIKILVVMTAVILMAACAVVWHLTQQIHEPININSETIYQVKSGQSAKGVLNRLKDQGVLNSNLGLKITLKLQPQLSKIKVGTYQLLPSMSGVEVLQLFSSGKELQFSVSLIEGLKWTDWLQTLQSNPHIVFNADFQAKLNELTRSLPEQAIEGYLLPDTYYFVDQTPAFEIVQRAHNNMLQYLDNAWVNRAVDLPYENAYEGLIMASIIEKETGVADERPRIAGVFVNRLRLNMRLQTDPTVIYGMGDSFDGNIRRKDLRTATPYNTYVIKGLPPTPIAMVGKLAIEAAFHPLDTDELYFVSKGDGSHQFSRTLQEHNSAVRTYQLKK